MPIRPANSRMQSFTQQADGPVSVRPTIGSKANTSASFQGGATLDRERGGRMGSISGTSPPSSIAASTNTNVGALRGQLRPVSRIVTAAPPLPRERADVFADRDYDDTASDTGSPADWGGNRSTTSSAATSVASLSRTPSNNNNAVFGGVGVKKAPPPPPPSRAKKPPPPVPARREVGY
jgi:hypothetical protein